MPEDALWRLVRRGVETLRNEDPALYQLLDDEFRRQTRVLTMVAASSIVDPSVLVCESMPPVNVTAEGYPKARYHGGCSVIDDIERLIDFARFRQIADRVGAYLLADITHVAGLVVSGLHPNPIDHAHITTTCTHKQLYGPRGGLVLIGRDHASPSPTPGQTLAQHVQSAVFPFFQGAPNLNQISSKASALARILRPEFRELAARIVGDARALAESLMSRGYRVITGGTDNHLVVIDVLSAGITGIVAERALEDCGIIVNKNRIPGDSKSPRICSGVRFGTNSLALRGLTPEDMLLCAELVHRVLANVRAEGEREYSLDFDVATSVREEVTNLCVRHPIPCYPTPQLTKVRD